MSADDAERYHGHLLAYENATGGPIASNYRHKVHLLFTWANELVRHPAILDAVEDIIGPNIICWTTNFFIKEADSPAFVSWHQDSTYWGAYRRAWRRSFLKPASRRPSIRPGRCARRTPGCARPWRHRRPVRARPGRGPLRPGGAPSWSLPRTRRRPSGRFARNSAGSTRRWSGGTRRTPG